LYNLQTSKYLLRKEKLWHYVFPWSVSGLDIPTIMTNIIFLYAFVGERREEKKKPSQLT